MTISMYQASAPVFLRALSNLRHILEVGEAHAAKQDIKPEVLLQTRLIPDMLPLMSQVRIATDLAKNGCARLAGVDPLKFDDDETDFAQLYARIDRAVDYIKGFKPEQIDGSEERKVTISNRAAGEIDFTGINYLLYFTQPNLYFHVATAYDILRQSGVKLGKPDFIGGLPG